MKNKIKESVDDFKKLYAEWINSDEREHFLKDIIEYSFKLSEERNIATWKFMSAMYDVVFATNMYVLQDVLGMDDDDALEQFRKNTLGYLEELGYDDDELEN